MIEHHRNMKNDHISRNVEKTKRTIALGKQRGAVGESKYEKGKIEGYK